MMYNRYDLIAGVLLVVACLVVFCGGYELVALGCLFGAALSAKRSCDIQLEEIKERQQLRPR